MSLNTKLFFKINSLVNQNRALDWFGWFGAEFAVVISVGWYIASLFINMPRSLALIALYQSATIWFFGLVVNYIIGFIVRKPRPMITHAQVKMLVKPLTTWKTFPSDHTFTAFLVFFLALFFHLPFWGIFLFLALWVGWGRIYAGAHYPADVLGGFIIALIMVFVLGGSIIDILMGFLGYGVATVH